MKQYPQSRRHPKSQCLEPAASLSSISIIAKELLSFKSQAACAASMLEQIYGQHNVSINAGVASACSKVRGEEAGKGQGAIEQ